METTLVKTDELFAKIERQLSSYTNNGLLDTNTFFAEVALVINKLGIAAYDMVEAVVTLENYKTSLPCNFYLLDSAWLCTENQQSTQTVMQKNFVYYTETTKETISQNTGCGISPTDKLYNHGLILQSTPCNNNNENVLDKITIREYMNTSGESAFTFRNPVLLTLRNNKSLNTPVCSKDCKNLFAKSPYEITINQQGLNKFLHSTLKEPVIFLKYYAYPEDPETGLPLIPENPIIQRAIEYHLMHYFFYMTWLDGNDVNLDRKLQALRQDRDLYMKEAENYSKFPSFNKTIEMMRKSRRRWTSYEALGTKHF
jgi:hypothetical protein